MVAAALKKEDEESTPAIAIQTDDGEIITGKSSQILSASAAAVINTLKHMVDIRDEIHVIPPAH